MRPWSPSLRERLALAARELGLARVGVAALRPLPHRDVLERWLAEGRGGELRFPGSPAGRADPRSLDDGAASAIVAALPCPPAEPRRGRGPEPAGRIARFAQRADYHTELHRRLRRLAALLAEAAGRTLRFRIVVDTAPLLERELAMAAGIGFIGKSTMLVVPGLGTHLTLGTLLVDLELPADAPAHARCGRCRRCLDACPTGALDEPYRIDARRCISYLTIEHRGPVAPELRPLLAPWLYGCDLCQEACPYNHGAATRRLAEVAGSPSGPPPLSELALAELLALTSTGYRRLVRGRTLRRVDRAQLVRNAALCAGGLARRGAPPRDLAPALARVAERFPHPVAAEAARWALEQLR
jgi:epoxyqueuosine reductase